MKRRRPWLYVMVWALLLNSYIPTTPSAVEHEEEIDFWYEPYPTIPA